MGELSLTTQTLRVLNLMLSDRGAEWYGLELSKRSDLKPGTIYPMLDRLLKVGWLERRWEDIDPALEGRPRRRLYRLTGIGARAAGDALEEHLASLRRLQPRERFDPSPRPSVA
jgi:DNA-binding PadR family transcriptional regulator